MNRDGAQAKYFKAWMPKRLELGFKKPL